MKIRKYELIREPVDSWEYQVNISNSENVADFLKDCLRLHQREREQFITLSLDSKGGIVGVSIDSVGSLDSSIVSPREVFKQAILSNASSIIVAHNHPSGDITPSPQDKAVTERLKNAGECLGIKLLDHLIVGDVVKHFSFAGEGLL